MRLIAPWAPGAPLWWFLGSAIAIGLVLAVLVVAAVLRASGLI